MSVDPLARDFAWNSPFSYAENDVIRSIDLEGAEKLIVHLQVSEDGKPVLDVRTVEKAINLVQRKYDDLDVNLDVELKIGGSILSNEDFKSRKDYHWSDSYTIIGNSSQLEKIDMIAEENGWEHIGAGDGGAAARFQFYSHISTKVINGYTDPDPIQRLNFSLQHESGHPKFRFHIDNLAGSNNARVNDTEVSNELKNHGTLGHIPGTIMNGGPYPIDYDYNNTNYDLYMTRMLRYIHGTKNGERSRDELIEAKTNPQFSSLIIEDAKKIKDETDLFTKGTKKLKG